MVINHNSCSPCHFWDALILGSRWNERGEREKGGGGLLEETRKKKRRRKRVKSGLIEKSPQDAANVSTDDVQVVFWAVGGPSELEGRLLNT